jgi:hypothetical protein
MFVDRQRMLQILLAPIRDYQCRSRGFADRTKGEPSQEQVLRAAMAYVKSGLSLIPIRADGSKMPEFGFLPRRWCPAENRFKRTWLPFRERKPSKKRLRRWFAGQWAIYDYGMAVLTGAISGNLEVLDLDNWGVVEPWQRLVEVRRKYGLEGSQVVLGHSTANVTQIYAERDFELAKQIMSEIG